MDKDQLEKLYGKYNNKKYIHPDPLEFLYNYEDNADREVVGLVAASLAYGKVTQILKSVALVLEKLSPGPASAIAGTSVLILKKMFAGFKHRFTTGEELAIFLFNIGEILQKYGSINSCFTADFDESKEMLPSILSFIKKLRAGECEGHNSLVPIPNGKCAYKRMNLYLRWMIRKDEVDPGVWSGISPSKLIIPLDTHMHRISLSYKLTERKQADFNTALEITRAFKKFSPGDPVKYDFALTRLGIHVTNKLGVTNDM
ncbi:MAG: TIGR02757 family protein [Actinobacteria bacterium]|nr:TIGR02757 family protein [Actinomycetota bacterium]